MSALHAGYTVGVYSSAFAKVAIDGIARNPLLQAIESRRALHKRTLYKCAYVSEVRPLVEVCWKLI